MPTVKVSKDVVFRDVAGEAVLLDLATGNYFGLNATGTRMWTLLADLGDPEQVVRMLLDEYEIAEDTLRSDLQALIRDLELKGVIVVG